MVVSLKVFMAVLKVFMVVLKVFMVERLTQSVGNKQDPEDVIFS